MPNSSGRASVLNGQFPLDRAAYTTKQPMVRALMRTALTRQGKTKPQSEQWNHLKPDRDRSFAEWVSARISLHSPGAPKIRYLRNSTTKRKPFWEGTRGRGYGYAKVRIAGIELYFTSMTRSARNTSSATRST
jgi:hypothetical protein